MDTCKPIAEHYGIPRGTLCIVDDVLFTFKSSKEDDKHISAWDVETGEFLIKREDIRVLAFHPDDGGYFLCFDAEHNSFELLQFIDNSINSAS